MRVCFPAWIVTVATSCSYEFLDAPTCLVLGPVADGQGCEHAGHVGADGVAGAVVDRAARSWMDLTPDTSLVLHADAFQDFTFRWVLGSAVGRFQWCR